jgi:hypothetical protein
MASPAIGIIGRLRISAMSIAASCSSDCAFAAPDCACAPPDCACAWHGVTIEGHGVTFRGPGVEFRGLDFNVRGFGFEVVPRNSDTVPLFLEPVPCNCETEPRNCELRPCLREPVPSARETRPCNCEVRAFAFAVRRDFACGAHTYGGMLSPRDVRIGGQNRSTIVIDNSAGPIHAVMMWRMRSCPPCGGHQLKPRFATSAPPTFSDPGPPGGSSAGITHGTLRGRDATWHRAISDQKWRLTDSDPLTVGFRDSRELDRS